MKTVLKKGIALLLSAVCAMVLWIPATAQDSFALRELSRYVLEESLYFTGASVNMKASDLIGDFVTGDTYRIFDEDRDITETAETMRTGLRLVNTTADQSVTIVVKGDLNGDGKLLSTDYVMLKKVFSGALELTGAAKNAADINQDGKILSADYLLLKKYFAGIDYFKKDIDIELSYVDFTEVKNVIYMIGDGMGPSHIDAAREVSGGNLKGKFYMDYIPNRGYERTNSLDGVTDSAAGATALATGYKTHNGVIGRNGEGQDVQTLLELCQSMGMKTGVMSTKNATDATPACFTAHTASRSNTYDIAYQQLMNMPEVLIGQMDEQYLEALRRKEVKEKFETYGVRKLYGNSVLLKAPEDRLFGIVTEEIALPELTEKMLSVLSKDNGNGFFAMIEGGKIDTYSHSNDADGMVRELVEFDLAVKEAMEFVAENPDTLLIVTADHETGGIQYTPGESPVFKFTTSGHTGANCYVMALGYGAEYFNGETIENTDIPKFIAKQLGKAEFGS